MIRKGIGEYKSIQPAIHDDGSIAVGLPSAQQECKLRQPGQPNRIWVGLHMMMIDGIRSKMSEVKRRACCFCVRQARRLRHASVNHGLVGSSSQHRQLWEHGRYVRLIPMLSVLAEIEPALHGVQNSTALDDQRRTQLETPSAQLSNHKARTKARKLDGRASAKQKQVIRRHSSVGSTPIVQASLGALAKVGPAKLAPRFSKLAGQTSNQRPTLGFHLSPTTDKVLFVSTIHVPPGISLDKVVPLLIKSLTQHSPSSNLTQPTTARPPAPCPSVGEA